MSSRKNFELFLYKNRLNEKTLIELMPRLSTRSIESIIGDLDCSSRPQTDTLYVFTDGGCTKNGKSSARAAYSVQFSDDPDSNLYNFNTTKLVVKDPTNNKAELSAIRYVFKTVFENIDQFSNRTITICTDSMYCINCIDRWSVGWAKNGWKNAKGEDVKNQDIIKSIIETRKTIVESNKAISFVFQHVMSHTQAPEDKTSLKYKLWEGNDTVDKNIQTALDSTKNT